MPRSRSRSAASASAASASRRAISSFLSATSGAQPLELGLVAAGLGGADRRLAALRSASAVSAAAMRARRVSSSARIARRGGGRPRRARAASKACGRVADQADVVHGALGSCGAGYGRGGGGREAVRAGRRRRGSRAARRLRKGRRARRGRAAGRHSSSTRRWRAAATSTTPATGSGTASSANSGNNVRKGFAGEDRLVGSTAGPARTTWRTDGETTPTSWTSGSNSVFELRGRGNRHRQGERHGEPRVRPCRDHRETEAGGNTLLPPARYCVLGGAGASSAPA